MSVATRLAISIVVVSVISLVVATIVGVNTGQTLSDSIVDSRLDALRASAATNVAAEMTTIERAAETLGASPQVARSIDELADALADLDANPPSDLESNVEDLVDQYDVEFIEPLQEAGFDVVRRDLIDTDDLASLQLQTAYSLVDDDADSARDVDDARDGSDWSEVHRRVHPPIRSVADRLELADAFLVEPDDATIVYSVEKGPDLGTSLDVGPFSGTVVAGAVASVISDPSAGTVISDVSTYLPQGLLPVGAVATPVMDGEELAGVAVLVYSTEPITDQLTAGGDWDASGFPPTGETFMMAGDGTMRSEPRSFLEDPREHLTKAEQTGSIDEDGRVRIERSGTTVLTETAIGETLNAAQDDDESVEVRTSVIGDQAYSSTEPVPLDGVEWYVVSEVDEDVIREPLEDFGKRLIIGAAILVVVIAFAAVAWSAAMMSSIREMSERLRTWRTSTGPIDVPERSPVEIERLAASFTEMVNSLESQRAELTAARERRTELLQSMLPPQVAERVMSGELETVEEVPKVTVVVIVVAGLGELVRLGRDSANRELVDRLTAELDEIGERHGLERIKIVGDAYFAVCGHNRPYIDHAPRALSFAADAQDAVREQGTGTDHGLDVVIGIHTGPVNVGMTRETGLVYDVWGPTVSRAHDLARSGGRGQILISGRTHALLPDSVVAERVTETETDGEPGDDGDDTDLVFAVSAETVGGTV